VFAPALAREKAVRGIVVFGTLATRPPAYPGRSERFFTEFDAVDVPAGGRQSIHVSSCGMGRRPRH
jgi:hypothetical protein